MPFRPRARLTGCALLLFVGCASTRHDVPLLLLNQRAPASGFGDPLVQLRALGATLEPHGEFTVTLRDTTASRRALTRMLELALLRIRFCDGNLANRHVTRDVAGLPVPYRRRTVSLGISGRIAIEEDPAPFARVYNPAHPDADADGYHLVSNVNPASELADYYAARDDYKNARDLLARLDPSLVVQPDTPPVPASILEYERDRPSPG